MVSWQARSGDAARRLSDSLPAGWRKLSRIRRVFAQTSRASPRDRTGRRRERAVGKELVEAGMLFAKPLHSR
jgi:hypothetical protein